MISSCHFVINKHKIERNFQDMERISASQRESNLSSDSLSQRKYAKPKRKRRSDYARASSTQPYSDHNNHDENKG